MRIPEYLPRFAEFSHFIASDDVLSIYRRFETLSARNNLYLQAELQSLEFQLNQLDEEDALFIQTAAPGSGKDNIEEAARVWESFSAQVDAGVDRQVKRMVLIKRVQEPMKEYEESLLRRSQILSLPKPSPQSLDAFTSFFYTKTPFLRPSYELLSSSGSLLSLKLDTEGPDRLSIFIQRYFGYYLAVPDPTRPPSWQPLYYFPARRIARIVACLSILISALLVVGAILTLYYIPSTEMGKRVAAIGAFTTSLLLRWYC